MDFTLSRQSLSESIALKKQETPWGTFEYEL